MTPNNGSRSGEGDRGDRPRRPAARLAAPWRIERRLGAAGSLFSDSEPAAPAQRSVRVLDVDRPALVLGSTQRWPGPPAPGRARLDVDVVRRRSGGGAVLLRPGETVWVDVVVPADDPLWEVDVGRSFHWLGEVWACALATLGVAGRVHRGALVATRWSRAVCFAGVGAGEVVAGAGGKVVGMASRRTREWALFQCAVPLAWDPAAYVAALDLAPAAVAELAVVAAPVTGRSGADVVEAFLDAVGTGTD